MNVIPINELYSRNYLLNVVNGLKQSWKNGSSFSCVNNPKRVNIFVYMNDIKAEYITKNGEKKYAGPGDIVYTPIGCEYSVRFFDYMKGGYTVGVNFFAYDETNIQFVLSEDIVVFKNPLNVDYKMLFSKISVFSESAVVCPGKMKAGMYDIISQLSELYRIKKQTKFDIIMKGIEYLEHNSGSELEVKEIAELCNVSTGYFRRLFKEYASVSPKEYIINNKIEKAKLYIRYENMTINEIAERLNFTDAAYFAKQFKLKTGMTPREYRNTVGEFY